MKILIVSALFPPNIKGGAELSAHNAAQWLRQRGHEIGVLTTAATRSEVVSGELVNGLRIWRVLQHRPYTRFESDSAPRLKKYQWHLQDYLDPRNVQMMSEVVTDFRPDVAQLHLVPGIGHNSLSVFNSKRIPVVYFLHDLGLACVRGSMYRRGKNCERQCLPCIISSHRLMSFIKDESLFSFVSPSKYNLERVSSLVNIRKFPTAVLPNLDFDNPLARIGPSPVGRIQILYVGRLHQTKGVEFLLDLLERLRDQTSAFDLTVVGGGPLEQQLLERYGRAEWVAFTGHVPPETVKLHMSKADFLAVPSVWKENHPGVVRQAIRAGVPAVVSDVGGMPEMVDDGVTGMILPPSDYGAWTCAVKQLTSGEPLLKQLQAGAREAAKDYSVDALGVRLEGILLRAVALAKGHAKPCEL